MGVKITEVDAFTSQPFGGNPAAVCIVPQPRDGSWMQLATREMNLSETAFLHRQNDGYGLRWFTSTVEVALCGHATLASAHVLWEEGHLSSDEQARFHTRLLTTRRVADWIELDFPTVSEEPAGLPAGLEEALGVKPAYVGRNRFDYLVELESAEVVRGVKPDFGVLRRLAVRGIMVTSRSASPEYDFVSRYFAPASGIDEDSATGSAHCCLGPFLGQASWQDRVDRLPGLGARRGRGGRLDGRAGKAQGPGCDGAGWRAKVGSWSNQLVNVDELKWDTGLVKGYRTAHQRLSAFFPRR